MSAFSPWRRDVRRDTDDELRFHFDARIAELVGQGLPPDEARARAVAEFGDVDEVRSSLKTIDDRLAADGDAYHGVHRGRKSDAPDETDHSVLEHRPIRGSALRSPYLNA